MTPELLKYLCDPLDHTDLEIVDAEFDHDGLIQSGILQSRNGSKYPIENGIPRFVYNNKLNKAVKSFGDEWNEFNFDLYKLNWLHHTVKNTFETRDVFINKIVVDAGVGSGMQSRWILESGAKHVISLELSHSVDQVMKKNLHGLFDKVDIIQCSIDAPPIKKHSIDGIVYCHNVIQHTQSVRKTACALWDIVGDGGEFVFNCYPKNDQGIVRKLRLKVNNIIRNYMSDKSFGFIRNYARLMSILRFIPVFGPFLEKSTAMFRGNVPKGPNYLKRAYMSGVLNTFDWFGTHAYQHYTSNNELLDIIETLQPNKKKVKNTSEYFSRPPPIGIAIRLFR